MLPPSFYPQQEHQLPPLDQPMFQVGARKIDVETPRDEKAATNDDDSFNDAIKNNMNKNLDIPDVEIPPIPFTIKKNN